ncbi:GNAT family N-acetyltransferase [Undibacterium crateris]|uniref:GNAT family N-acetyltransferase n=1 Tax=Undibacterium crateris TaxID=2528175 RepID=UPI00138A3696|nr:GNAT family N-acetyltransferase [Undibacterium crateris]NDI85399.1 GNAT family N-acetyltransferase [Undibacterium crateris]
MKIEATDQFNAPNLPSIDSHSASSLGNVSDPPFEILERYRDVSPFLSQVVQAADKHRNALGFFPASVFEDFAQRDRLFIIITKSDSGMHYVGHLLFRPQFPRAHVMQMLILPEFRRQGLAAKLVEHFKTLLTHHGFISIYARVAEDLSTSNEFWHKQEFYVQRVAQGGATRNRKILVRCHELASPQLFPTSGFDAQNPLDLVNSPSNISPLFLLDLNVLFDIGPRRLRHADAASLFQAERSNFCRLAISTEIREELQRNAQPGRTDPMEAYISIYPSFPLHEGNETQHILEHLATLIFPTRKVSGLLSANDFSDLRHVATAIQHNLAGLITNDKAILAAASVIKIKYGIEIVSPSAFKLEDSDTAVNTTFDARENGTLNLLEVTNEDESTIRAFLRKIGLSGSSIAGGWLPIDPHGRIAKCCAVWNSTTLIGYATWAAKGGVGAMTVRIAIDETNSQALSATRILLMYFLENNADQGSQNIKLELPPNQSHVRELSAAFGFSGTSDQHCLMKLALGDVLTEKNWKAGQTNLEAIGSVKLPVSIPTFRSADQQIQIFTSNGNQRHVTLDDLETLLSPALFCLPGRPSVLTPILSNFAAELLGNSPQGSLLPRSTASLYHDRHYLSDPKTLRHFKKGTLILFYESTRNHGRAAVIAIARVREAYLRPIDADASDLEHSVFTPENLVSIGKSKMKTVTVFDNIFYLKNPVPLEALRRMGCGEPNQLITTRPLTDEQLQKILAEGFDT